MFLQHLLDWVYMVYYNIPAPFCRNKCRLGGVKLKYSYVFVALLMIALLVLITGCSTGNFDYPDPNGGDIQYPPSYITPEPIPLDPVLITVPEPAPVNKNTTAPVVDSAYQELIKLMHSSVERLSALIIGLFTAQGEEREYGSLAIVFHALDAQLDYRAIAVHIAEQIRPYVTPNLMLMQEIGMAHPPIILEFRDAAGEVIYTSTIDQNGEPAKSAPPVVTPSVSDLAVPAETVLIEDAILLFLKSQQETIAKVREEMDGMGTFSIEAQDSRTIACVVHITDESISDKVTEEKINDEILPMLRGTFAQYVPILEDMGVSNPRVMVIVYNPGGEVLISTGIS
jgi:hypothetical protein